MGKTRIEWCTASNNSLTGCTKISPGCANCYAERSSHVRRANPKLKGKYANATRDGRWTGVVEFHPEVLKKLDKLSPEVFFMNSMSDMFHEDVKEEWINEIFEAMNLNTQHRYWVLTKRPGRMLEYLEWVGHNFHIFVGASICTGSEDAHLLDLHELKARHGWETFASFEPWLDADFPFSPRLISRCLSAGIIGGESGPGARPFHQPALEQAIAVFREAKVPLFVKQLGSQGPLKTQSPHDKKGNDTSLWPGAWRVRQLPPVMERVMGAIAL